MRSPQPPPQSYEQAEPDQRVHIDAAGNKCHGPAPSPARTARRNKWKQLRTGGRRK